MRSWDGVQRVVEDREERARVREPLTFVDELYALFLS